MSSSDRSLREGIEEYLVSLRVERGLSKNTLEQVTRVLGAPPNPHVKPASDKPPARKPAEAMAAR